MAKNLVYDPGQQLQVALANKTSGDPVVVGQLAGVALTGTDADGNLVMKHDGVFSLSVKGVDGGGNSAIAIGDIIYYVDADTPKLSKKNTGVRFGYALGAVASGATAAVPIKVGY